jgi:hypothetical protein
MAERANMRTQKEKGRRSGKLGSKSSQCQKYNSLTLRRITNLPQTSRMPTFFNIQSAPNRRRVAKNARLRDLSRPLKMNLPKVKILTLNCLMKPQKMTKIALLSMKKPMCKTISIIFNRTLVTPR